jgi:hypothetical protein
VLLGYGTCGDWFCGLCCLRLTWSMLLWFPPPAAIAATATAGPLADSLLARGMPLPTVRKLVQASEA